MLDPALLTQLAVELREDGVDTAVRIAMEPGRGRLLLATRDLTDGETLLSAPREHQVMMPLTPADSDSESSSKRIDAAALCLKVTVSSYETVNWAEEINRPNLMRDYAKMKEICCAENSTFDHCSYWAALFSLTADEGPLDAEWPCISAAKQARLLTLHHPVKMSSLCEGQEGTSPSSAEPHRTSLLGSSCPSLPSHPETAEMQRESMGYVPSAAPSVQVNDSEQCADKAVSALCQHFALKVVPSKLAALVMVWKYNAFRKAVKVDDSEPYFGLEIFIMPSFCNHSCSPNCRYGETDEDGRWRLVAGSDGIASGEEITISYMDLNLVATMKAYQRREYLADNWSFFCTCALCMNTTLPSCPQCSAAEMAVVVSDNEEALYPGLDVFCDVCHEEDLQFMHSYFFHCGSCDSDSCPPCAAKQQLVSDESVSEVAHVASS